MVLRLPGTSEEFRRKRNIAKSPIQFCHLRYDGGLYSSSQRASNTSNFESSPGLSAQWR